MLVFRDVCECFRFHSYLRGHSSFPMCLHEVQCDLVDVNQNQPWKICINHWDDVMRMSHDFRQNLFRFMDAVCILNVWCTDTWKRIERDKHVIHMNGLYCWESCRKMEWQILIGIPASNYHWQGGLSPNDETSSSQRWNDHILGVAPSQDASGK